MPQQQQQLLRKLMIELVLATDMAEHMAIVSRLKTDVLKRLEAPDDSFEINDEMGEPLKALILQAAIKVSLPPPCPACPGRWVVWILQAAAKQPVRVQSVV